jgi:hypothetical protein
MINWNLVIFSYTLNGIIMSIIFWNAYFVIIFITIKWMLVNIWIDQYIG